MNCLRELTTTLSPLCRSALPIGLSLLCQSTVLLLLGLLLGKGLFRRGPIVQTWVHRTTLVGTVLSACLCVLLAGRFQTVWRLALPQTPSTRAVEPTPIPLHLPMDEPVLPGIQHNPRPSPPTPLPKHGRGEYAVLPDAKANAALVRSLGNPILIEVPSVRTVGAQRPAERRHLRREAEPDGSFIGTDWNRIPLLYAVPVALWSGGLFLGLLWLALCQLSLRRIRRDCVPITSGDEPEIVRALCPKRMRPPQLLAGERVPSPFLTGLWRPAILLPASYRTDFDGPALRAILAHELAHIARRDCAWHLLVRLICIVGWVQPLLWILCRRLEQAGEEACDQIVLETGCAPETYAHCLLTLAERLRKGHKVHAVGVGAVAFRSSLGQRMQRILNYPSQHVPPFSPRMQAAFLVSLLTLAVVCPALVSAKVETSPAISKPAPHLIPLLPASPKFFPLALPPASATAASAYSSTRPVSALTVHPHQPQTTRKKTVHLAAFPTSVERQIEAWKAEYGNLVRGKFLYLTATEELAKELKQRSKLEAQLAEVRTKSAKPSLRLLMDTDSPLELQMRQLELTIFVAKIKISASKSWKERLLNQYLVGSARLRTELQRKRMDDTAAFRKARNLLLASVRLLDREVVTASKNAAVQEENTGPASTSGTTFRLLQSPPDTEQAK